MLRIGIYFIKWIARYSSGRKMISRVIRYMNFILPIDCVIETEFIIGFKHPVSSYPVHVLLIPKKAVEKLIDLDKMDHQFWVDLIDCVRRLVDRYGLEKVGYRLIVNGGPYQEFNYLHFHLVSENRGNS